MKTISWSFGTDFLKLFSWAITMKSAYPSNIWNCLSLTGVQDAQMCEK